ncbi:MAG: GNAT family N-acetyltransferase [Lachnospiraceae bacterium]
MELIKDYMRDDVLRHKLNELTRKTFGFDFESWVVNGYFEGDYIPYSFIEDGRIISNVSANRMQFVQNGVRKDYIQIGTVMTDESYRHQGLARKLMEHVISQYENRCDGIYLFGALSALDFYRKMGFEEGLQYQYILKEEYCGLKEAYSKPVGERKGFQPVDRQDEQMKRNYMDAVRKNAVNASLEQMNKFGLQMFYTADMSDVYYAEDIDCFAVMEMCDDTLILQSVISKETIPLKDILARIGMKYRCLTSGFAPCDGDAYLFDTAVYDGGEDYRLFYRGKALESIEKEKLFFPLLSHA